MLSEAARPVCTFIASPVHCVCVCECVCAYVCPCAATVCLILPTLECLSYRELGVIYYFMASKSFNVRTLIGWKDIFFYRLILPQFVEKKKSVCFPCSHQVGFFVCFFLNVTA